MKTDLVALTPWKSTIRIIRLSARTVVRFRANL